MPANVYPRWDYFPRNVRPPEWVEPLVAEVRAIEQRISTVDQGTGLHSNDVLQELAPGLRHLGYAVESSRSEANRIRRPVLFSQLTALVKTRLRQMQYRPGLLEGFLAKPGLDLTPLQ